MPSVTQRRPVRAKRASGRWAGRTRSTPPSRPSRTTTGSTCGPGSCPYAREGFESIDPSDLRGRFSWWGLYTQRRPGIDGGRTGVAGGRRHRGPLLHDAGADPRRSAHGGAAARDRLGRPGVRPRPRRRHRPAERAVPLDPHRGRPGDLGAARGGRPVHDDDLRRRPAQHPRLPGRGHRRERGPRRDRDARAAEALARGNQAFTNLPRKWKSAISGCASHCTRARDQRRLVRGRDRTRTANRASTSGSVAASRRTPCSPTGSAPS